MLKCQLGMQKNVQGHRIASVCKQTYDASCILNKCLSHITYITQSTVVPFGLFLLSRTALHSADPKAVVLQLVWI